MATINVTADVNDAINAFNQYNNTLAGLSVQVEKITKQFVQFDAAGNPLSTRIQGLTKDGQSFNATLKETTVGLALTSIGYTKSGDAALTLAQKQAKANAELKQSIALNNIFTSQLSTISGILERFVFYKVFNLITDSIKNSTNAAKDYQIQVSLIRTLSQDNQLSTTKWANSLKEVSDQLGIPLLEVAKAGYDAISNQVVSGTRTFEFLKTAGDLARVTGGNIKDAVNTLSTVINSYNLTASEAENISSLLFNTIDKGRVKLDDLANSLGPITALGKGLGTELTDITGFLAFLTQKGTSSAQALTFIRNVFVQLEKPTADLQELFKKLGVSTGEAAIQTYKLSGILDIINREVKAGNTGVAQLFPEIRANQPIQAALNDLKGLKDIIKEQQDQVRLVANFDIAKEIRGESPADFINKEFNKLRNSFTADIGEKILGLAKDFLVLVAGTRSLTDAVNDVLVVIRNGVIIITAFRTGLILTRGVMLLYASTTTSAAVATTGLNTSMTLASVTMRALPFAVVASGLAYLATKLIFTDDILKKNGEGFEIFADRIKAFNDASRTSNPVLDPNADAKKRVEESAQIALKVLAQVNVKNSEVLNNLRNTNKTATQEIASSFGIFSQSLKDKVSDIGRKISDTESVLKRIKDTTLSFSESIQNTILSSKLKYATDIQAVKIIQAEIEKQKTRAKDLVLGGTPEGINEAIKIYDTIEKLTTQHSDKLVEIAKAGQLELAKDQGIKVPKDAFSLGIVGKASGAEAPVFGDRSILALKINTQILYAQRLLNLEKERENLITVQGTKLLEDRKSKLEQQKAQQEKNIKDITDAFKKFNEFSPFDTSGKIKKEFQNPLSGALDPKKLEAGLKQAQEGLLKLTGGDFSAIAGLQNKFNDRQRAITEEARLTERQALTEQAQQKVQQLEKNFKTELDNNRKIAEEKGKLNNQLIDQLIADSKVIPTPGEGAFKAAGNQSATNLAQGINKTVNTIGTLGGLLDLGSKLDENVIIGNKQSLENAKQKVIQLQLQREEYNKTIELLKSNSANVNGILIPRPEDLENAKSRLTGLFGSLQDTLKASQGNNFDPDAPNVLLGGQSFNNVKKAAFQIFDQLKNNTKDLGILQGDKGRLQLQFEGQAQSALEALGKGFSAQELAIINETTATIDNTSITRDLNETIKGIQAIPITPGKNAGGWVGGKVGYDANLTPTTNGEYIVNAESAAQYSDVLESINRSKNSYVSNIGGNNVSNTKVGDIVVNVHMQQGESLDAEKLGSIINRGIKRGTIRINGS